MSSPIPRPTQGESLERRTAQDAVPSAVTGRTTADLQRVRAIADVAFDVIGDYYGLDAAVAVNPLLPHLADGFAVAATEAAAALGAPGSLDEATFRALLESGRIRRADLAAAIRRHDAAAADANDTVDERGTADENSTTDEDGSDDALIARFLAAAPRIPNDAPAAMSSRPSDADRRTARVDDRLTRFARAWFAADEAAWTVRADRGFYGDWRMLALVDPTLSRRARRTIRELPERADAVIARHLAERRVDDIDALELLARHAARTPGWSSALRRRAATARDIDTVEFLAVRLALTSALGAPAPSPSVAAALSADRLLVWQEALEACTHDAVLRAVSPALSRMRESASADTAREAAHIVTCIDVRSEGLRRHLEAVGPYGTSGFAGFFGVAARISPLGAAGGVDACPVLLSPRHAIAERPRPGTAPRAKTLVDSLRSAAAWRGAMRTPEKEAPSALGWAELSGWLLGPLAALRSVAPGAGGDARRPDEPREHPPTLFDLDTAMTIEEQVMTAETILTTMGMSRFAPLVVLLGHGATTTNTPFRSALDCGACGGHRGGSSARIAAALLNAPAVRDGLAGRGIVIPDTTVFVGGEHDTVTDRVVLHDKQSLGEWHRSILRALEIDLAVAGQGLRRERLAELPGGRRVGAEAEVQRRAADWAQVFPEWGLARNAAIIIGPRDLTRGVNLERRAFLHSYDPKADVDGVALTTILTAPLVVAHWINAQYYFSTVAPDVLGAGTKTVHNLVGGLGVLAGPDGDLRIGLPQQSVMTREGLHHEPLRLLAVVAAPLDRIDRIIARHDVVRDLVEGGWVRLVAPAEDANGWVERGATGWTPRTRIDNDTLTTTKEAA